MSVCVECMEKEMKKLACSQCNSKMIYTLKDKTKVCRKCGFREKNVN